MAVFTAGWYRYNCEGATFDASKESKLSPLEWLDALGCFVSLTWKHLWAGNNADPGSPTARSLANLWAVHFQHIQTQSDFEDRFSVYLEYDMQVCQQFVANPNSFPPDVWHPELFHAILDNSLVKLAAFHGSTPKAGASSSFCSSSLSGLSKPHDGEQRTSSRCMFCGGKDHPFHACPGGGKTKLQKDDDGIWRDLEGHTYCINFNGPHACPCKDACQHLHACSLCLCRDHGTQMCTI